MGPTLRQVLDERTSETELQNAIIDYARARRWLVYHTHNSRHSEKGFPDLVLVRAPRLIFAELKRQQGKVSLEQQLWIDKLDGCDVEVYVWRPSDWTSGEIEESLA